MNRMMHDGGRQRVKTRHVCKQNVNYNSAERNSPQTVSVYLLFRRLAAPRTYL